MDEKNEVTNSGAVANENQGSQGPDLTNLFNTPLSGEKVNLGSKPVTRDAFRWLTVEMGVDIRDPIFNGFRRRAKETNLQLTLEQVRETFFAREKARKDEREERKQALGLRPDPDAPETETCAVIGIVFKPTVRNHLRMGQIVLQESGPRKGEPKLDGNYLASKTGKPQPVSREGLVRLNDERKKRGESFLRGLSFQEAKYLSEKEARINANIAAIEGRTLERRPKPQFREKRFRTRSEASGSVPVYKDGKIQQVSPNEAARLNAEDAAKLAASEAEGEIADENPAEMSQAKRDEIADAQLKKTRRSKKRGN